MSKYKHKVAGLLILFYFNLASGQKLISSEEHFTINTFLLNLQLSQFGLPEAKNDVTTYKVIYESVDAQGNTAIASGIIGVPEGVTEPPSTIVYHHGTTQRSSVPSTEVVGLDAGSGFLETLLFASQGYLVLTPDYIGMGESEGFHTYIHALSYGRDGDAMLKALPEFLVSLNLESNDNLFITGYSEGGYGSMALHHYLETNALQTVTAGSHLSGPYSVSKIMVDAMIADINYPPGVIFLPYTVLGMQQAYGNLYNDLRDVFKAPYVDAIEAFSESGLFDPLGALTDSLIALEDSLVPSRMLQDSIIEVLSELDPAHPISAAVLDNDLIDWTPIAPTRLFYCEADEQVPFMNAIVADSAFQANGAGDVVAESQGADLDHGGCVVPALEATLNFFNSFITTTSITSLGLSEIQIFPNPASEYVDLNLQHLGEHSSIDLFNSLGQLVLHKSIGNLKNLRIDVAEFQAGLYNIRVSDGKNFTVRPLIIHR